MLCLDVSAVTVSYFCMGCSLLDDTSLLEVFLQIIANRYKQNTTTLPVHVLCTI